VCRICEPHCSYLVARFALQFDGCVIGRQGFAEVISLNLIASVFPQEAACGHVAAR